MIIIPQEAREDFKSFMMRHHRETSPQDVIKILKDKPSNEISDILTPWIVRNPKTLEAVICEFGIDVIPDTYQDEYISDFDMISWEESGLYGYIGDKMNSIALKHHYNPKDQYIDDINNLVESLIILNDNGFTSSTLYTRDSVYGMNKTTIDYKDKLNEIIRNPDDVFDIIYKRDLINEACLFLHDNLNISKFQMEEIAERLFSNGTIFWSFIEYARDGKLRKFDNMQWDARRILGRYDTTVLEAHNFWLSQEQNKDNISNYAPIKIITRKSAMKPHLAVDNMIRMLKNLLKARRSPKKFILYVDEFKDLKHDGFYGHECEFLDTFQELVRTNPKLTNGDDRVEYRIALFEKQIGWGQKERPYIIMHFNNSPDPVLKIDIVKDKINLVMGDTTQEKIENFISIYNREFNCNYKLTSINTEENKSTFIFAIVKK